MHALDALNNHLVTATELTDDGLIDHDALFVVAPWLLPTHDLEES